MREREARSLEAQRDILTHFGWEVAMCAWAAGRLRMTAPGRPDVWNPPRVSLLDSTLLHARNVIDLLLNDDRRVRSDDVCREDFPASAGWVPQGDAKLAADRLVGHASDINKFMAHLSWQRRERTREWTYMAVAKDAFSVVDDWAKHLGRSAPELEAALTAYLNDARSYLQPEGAVVSATTASTGPSGAYMTGGALGPTGPSA